MEPNGQNNGQVTGTATPEIRMTMDRVNGKPEPSPQGGQGTPPTNESAPNEATPEANQGGMTVQEKYWHDKYQALRTEYDRIEPMLQYTDIMGYLDANPPAVALLMNHMKENNPNIQEFHPEVNEAIHNNQPTPPNYGADQGGHHMGQPHRPSNVQVRERLRAEYDDFMRENGIPADEVDRYIDFMMNPDKMSREELFEMYRTVRNSRGEPIRTSEANPNNNPNQAQGQEAPKQGPSSEMPPMGIAGMSGGPQTNANEEEQINARARVRNILDPNNI